MSERKELIEIKSYEQEGYKPLVYHRDWMMAMLNYSKIILKKKKRKT